MDKIALGILAVFAFFAIRRSIFKFKREMSSVGGFWSSADEQDER